MTKNIDEQRRTPYKMYNMNFAHSPIIFNPNQFMIKCMPQNYFFQIQDLYKGYTNSLIIKLPYTIDKTTLLNIFLFYGKIEHIDINTQTNTILIEYYKIISAIKCYSEFKFNFNKLSFKEKANKENNNIDQDVKIQFANKSFEDKFFLGFKIKEKELFKTKINTDCLIKIISKVGKIFKIHQKMSFEFERNQQQICLNTIFVFNDSRDKEKAEFILRRIIYPYASHNQYNNSMNSNINMNNNTNRKFEETKVNKDENNNNYNNNNFMNNNNSLLNFNTIYESGENLNSFPLIYQYVKKDDEVELKDDYEISNKNKENINNNNNSSFNNNTNSLNKKYMNKNNNNKIIINENDENVNTMNIMDNNYNHRKEQKMHKEIIEKSVKSTLSSEINKMKYTGIKQRNTPAEERVKYVINLEKIINETDQRTTLMIKNIPRNVIQSYLMEIINKKFKNLFNFFYLPIDFIKKENAGYAFINFKNSKHIVDFYIEFNEKPWPFCQNRKCFISYARIQGFRAITQHFSSSNIMLVNNGEVKPYISDE